MANDFKFPILYFTRYMQPRAAGHQAMLAVRLAKARLPKALPFLY
ncbi:hypothetical protein HMPREF1981_02921 [Bacteroides pyogenes F0041]|uniref:Uncharacterized protein n=1 Tax=Bacteroides pyogenes F0041 TaxID=1321819 RepID=U2CB42_9BACE|nr:hypothetical protein HMPREF1981_02921 [Bacteroides pyogenes F0041]